MFEQFSFFGWRTHYAFAEIAASNGDAVSLVSCLDKVVSGVIPELRERNSDVNWERRAGEAFFNLAKTLDLKGKNFREGAGLSLSYAFRYSSSSGRRLRIKGLSKTQIDDYLKNPTSSVSLKELEFVGG
ncbi:MAG: hypothetical protein KKB31_01850 [Nanoarchaeota archaeon]|nr:hypothetical protein [Nanoarchaeota archaeon]